MMETKELRSAILATVAYADLFDFPLTSTEIHRFLIGKAATLSDVQTLLKQLIIDGKLRTQHGYYMLPERLHLVALREKRTDHANHLWKSAERYARWLSRIPFVRMVAVTGSLAVDNPQQDADIDFLIVTSNDRLWLCRLFVIGVVRWAARQGIELCPNYFLSERAIALSERDIYTGRELVQMRPLFGKQTYCKMVTANAWVSTLLPNSRTQLQPLVLDQEQFRPKRWLEIALNSPIGAWLERWEQRRRMTQLTAAAAHIPEAEFSPNRCKGHVTAHRASTKHRFESTHPSKIKVAK